MAFQIIQRRDYLHNWSTAEAASPPTGNLRRGEIAIAIVTSDGTDTGDIVEVIGRIGPSDTPTPFSDCPVVFRSPRGFKGADVRPVLVDEEPAVDSVLAYDSANNKFVSLDEDPGTYEEDDSGDDANELEEVSPSILVLSATGLTGSATAGTRADYTLSMEVVGRPNPILSIEIIELDYPDATNSLNYTQSTAYTFTTDSLPQNVTVTTSTDSSVSSALGATNYTISGLAVLRAAAVAKVGVAVRVSASNTAGVSPVTEFSAGSIAIVADQTGVTPEPRLTKVAISEGGAETSKIDNAATGASVTLTANYVASDFTDGVDNGAVAYQWLANGVELPGEASSSLTLTNTADAYNDSQLQVVVTIANDNGTNTRSAFIAIGDYDEGFTELTPSADSRLIYVAANGDDAAAANNQHSRGYYLPSDPEIGPDPTNPVGPITAYATHFEAAKRVRLSKASGEDANGFPLYASGNAMTGYPDWVLLRRGDSFLADPELAHPNDGVTAPRNLGELLGGAQQSTIGWDQSRNRLFYYCGPWRGRSASEPAVVAAWGNSTDERPVLTNFTVCGGARHLRITSIDVQGSFEFGWGDNNTGNAGDVLIEDAKAKSLGAVQSSLGTIYSYQSGLTVRRCTIADSFNPDSHNQGFFVNSPSSTLLVEECVFDRNGYKEDPNEPTTWTADIVSYQGAEGGLPVGTGVQQKRTYFDRNMYLARYSACALRGNIISRGGGGSSVQMRQGGVAERNLFLWNQAALIGFSNESYDSLGCLFTSNTVLHDDLFLPPGGWGTGIGGGGWSDDTSVVADNIVTHFHRGNNGGASFYAAGKAQSAKTPFPEKLRSSFILDNAAYWELGNGVGIEVPPTTHTWGVLEATVQGNAISTPGLLSSQGDPSIPASHVYTGNRFHSSNANGQFRHAYQDNGDKDYRFLPYTNATFSDWQSAGYDTDGTLTSDFNAFKSAVGWTAPERDILSYMQTVDPTYVVNEDVYVDDGATGQKQSVRQKVWEVLMSSTNNGNMDEARAKRAARRYHAFLAFIEKARANRKGAWDSRWTADAVNNYIREGFGKAPVGGAYTASMTDLLNYGASA